MGAHTIQQYLHNSRTKKIKDPGSSGTIVVDKGLCVVDLVTAAAETRTLSRPTKSGVIVTLYAKTITTSCTITPTGGLNELGTTTIVFSNAGEFAILEGFETATAGTYEWRLISSHILGNMLGLTATAAELNARAAAASRLVNVTDASTYTVLAADSGKIHIMPDFTASCTLTMPTVSAGLEYTFIGKAVAADAQNWIFQGPSAVSFLGGVAFADTDAGAGADEIHAGVWPNGSSNDFHTIVTPGAGTRIYMICDGTNWIVNGVVYSATVPTFSDT